MSSRIYNMLCDVIDYTYQNNTNENKIIDYKRFYVVYNNKMSNSDGAYNWKKRTVTLNNLYQDDTALLFNLLRLLAQHIDFRNRGITKSSDWQQTAEFERLLRSAISMGLIKILSIYDNIHLSEKEEAIMYKLEKECIAENNYKEDIMVFRIESCFDIKDVLRASGYKWLTNEKCWEKEVKSSDVGAETSFLEKYISLSKVSVSSAAQLLVTAYMWVLVYECYEMKEELKSAGYKYDGKERAWKKKFNVDDVKYELGRLANAGFRIVRTKKA